MTLLTINGLDITGLVTIQWDESTISASGSGRDEVNAEMTIDVITTKVNLPLTFGPLSWAQISEILNKLEENGDGGTDIEVTYPDAKAGKFLTKKFYAQDRSTPVLLADGDDIFWSGSTVTLTEM